MSDQVVVEGVELGEGVVMRVPERVVTLPDGATVWLRRYWYDQRGRRVWLSDGGWCAQRGGDIPHLYAVPRDSTHGGGSVWRYRDVHQFGTWGAALAAAMEAEVAEVGRPGRRSA